MVERWKNETMLDQETFREAWRKFATGVAVITTIESGGSVHGMAANGIASISLDPLLVLISVGHVRESNALIKSSGRFAINILSDQQEVVANTMVPLRTSGRGTQASHSISPTKDREVARLSGIYGLPRSRAPRSRRSYVVYRRGG